MKKKKKRNLYKTIFSDEFILPYDIKRTSNLETYLQALLKATNYSIQVLSFTLSGDGMASSPVYCSTEEDGNALIFSNQKSY